MWWTLWSACQEPFGADRHDLQGFRLAALAIPPASPGDRISPRAAVIVGGRPWSPAPIELTWFWVRDPQEVAELDPLSIADAVGPEPVLVVPGDRSFLGVVARGEGQEARAFAEIAPPPPTFGGPIRLGLSSLPLSIGALEGPELLPEAREALPAETADQIRPGGFARLSAEVDGDPLIRWMATAGTFLELDRGTADWAAGDLRLDGDELDGEPVPLDPGWVTVLALALGAPGETALRATDLPVGPPGPGLWTAGRFLPTDGEVGWRAGDRVQGILAADDRSPVGLRLTEAAIAPEGAAPPPPLDCLVTREGPFDPSWLLLQICGRDALDGATVVIAPEGGR